MNRCHRCGVPYHPDLVKCPLCRTLSRNESAKRRRFLYFTNTVAVSLVAAVVIVRVLTSPEQAAGMTQTDCVSVSQLSEQTRFSLELLTSDEELAKSQLSDLSKKWVQVSENYVPGKFSWSTSGPEHGWLERVGQVTAAISLGEEIAIDDSADSLPEYAVELMKVSYRFCSKERE